MFEREMVILAQLNHPRIVSYVHMGEYKRALYFVMEYVEAIDLRAYIEVLTPEARVADVMRDHAAGAGRTG